MIYEKISALMSSYISKNEIVVLGVSGGVDSMVLLHMLFEGGYTNVIVAHLNHQLRDEAKDDALFVKSYAELYNYQYKERTIDIAQRALEEKDSVENSGRKERYAFFEEIRKEVQGKWILTAHHADDLLESRMMHFLRGSGLRGFEGIKEYDSNRCILRPLLKVTKKDIISYATTHNLPWKEDHTNGDTRYLRNRIRHDLIPVCYSINPSFDTMMDRMAKYTNELEMFLHHQLTEKLTSLEEAEYEYSVVSTLPTVLLKEFLIVQIRTKDPQFSVTTAHIENIEAQFLHLASGRHMSLSPRLFCRRDFDRVYFSEERGAESINTESSLSFEHMPDEFSLGGYHCRIGQMDQGIRILGIHADQGVTIRLPRQGDRVCIVHGDRIFHKPLKKYFIEHKIPVHLRRIVPVIVTHSTGDVVALVGQQSLVIDTQEPCISLICEHE